MIDLNFGWKAKIINIDKVDFSEKIKRATVELNKDKKVRVNFMFDDAGFKINYIVCGRRCYSEEKYFKKWYGLTREVYKNIIANQKEEVKKPVKKLHHTTIKKMKKDQKEFEDKLNKLEDLIKSFLPNGFTLVHFQDGYFIEDNEGNTITQSIKLEDEFNTMFFEKSFTLITVINSLEKRYKTLLSKLDEYSII